MPLDDTKFLPRVRIDEMDVLGIKTIPTTIIHDYKAAMCRRYSGRPQAEWIEDDLPRDKLRHILSQGRYGLWEFAKAPTAVIAIAEYVRDVMPRADFVVGHFYTDPYLKVIYNNRAAYLGLWTHRRILKAIARRREDDRSQTVQRVRTFFLG